MKKLKEKNTYKKDSNNWFVKGNSFFDSGKFDEAIKCYDKALKINPGNDAFWYNKGLALEHLGKFDEAIKCYDKALEINPEDELFWNNKGNTLVKFGKIENAVKCYDKILELKNIKGIIERFIKKYPSNNLEQKEKLISLLKHKYEFVIDDACFEKLLDYIKNQVNQQKEKSKYFKFKSKILEEKPMNKGEYVDIFLKQYGPKHDDYLNFLKDLLSENKINLEIDEIQKLIKSRIVFKEMESFEKELLTEENIKENITIKKIRKKIQIWKDEGYDVSELEDMVKKVNE